MIAETLAYIALGFGILFFTYAIRYYLALFNVAVNLFRGGSENDVSTRNGGEHNNYAVRIVKTGNNNLKRKNNDLGDDSKDSVNAPLISIHVPLYNEERVVDRLMEALTTLDYPNYEVIVVDDSTDSTTEKLKKWSKNARVKIIHRDSRRGFKGGALNTALEHMSEDAKYVVVFDADFIPPKDILWRFLQEFENSVKGGDSFEVWRRKNTIVAVQGYQWHILNASENWITRSVTAEYAGNYLVERFFSENLPGVKMIAGSVFMIRADILRRYGWRESLTEDWDLTLRLYRDGYKVSYTPFVAAPAECPSTIMALMRQRARWAEGHTYAVKRYFWEIIRSKFLSLREKLEFMYLTPYYLNSFFFIMGTICWLIAELLHARIPFWTSIFGWSLLFTNLMAVPLVNLTGLFLEYRASRHWTGALGFIPLMHILALSQAVASLKGLFEEKESAWFRTLKTGRITELNIFYHLRRFLRREKKRKIEKKTWTILTVLPLMLVIARLIQIEAMGPMLQNHAIFTASIIPLIIMTCLSIHYRRKTTSVKPIVMKMMALATITMLIITLNTTIPTQAYVPQETLYFYPGAGEYPSGNPGKLSTSSPPPAQQPLDNGKTYWWKSEETYQFQDTDDGIWVFYFYGDITPQGATCSVSGEIIVQDDGTYSVGTYNIVGLSGKFEKTEPISVVFNGDIQNSCKDNGCNIIFTMSVSCDRKETTLHLYTGWQERYTRLEIPENLFLLLLLIPIFLSLSKRLKLRS
jgi:cellulose synthase/poly-beta-1,6-N-acetylglucosamine synthase-like glycosyltransferase